MRNSLISICLIFSLLTFPLYLGAKKTVKANFSPFNYGIIDGWYIATVKSQNAEAKTITSHSLNVKVVNNRVTVIIFKNGSFYKSGYNSFGYFYNGGNLSIETDINGNFSAAYTRIIIITTEGNTSDYYIRIE